MKKTFLILLFAITLNAFSQVNINPATLNHFRSTAASSTAINISSVPIGFYSYNITNNASGNIYVKLYNKVGATSSDTPLITIVIDLATVYEYRVPDWFNNACSIRCVTGSADNNTTSPSTSPTIEIRYY